MSINAISGTQVWGNYQMPGISQNSPGSANAAGAARHNHHHGGGMMKGVMQTLNQLGITPGATGQDGAAGGASGNPAQTVRAFMHKLAGALSGQNGAQTAGAKAMGDGNCASCRGCGGCPRGGGVASARGGYSNSASGLQNLLQALGANPAQQNSSLSDLNSAFTQMVQALGGTGATDAAGKQVDLQSFLQALALNMGGQQLGGAGKVNTTGGFVSAMA